MPITHLLNAPWAVLPDRLPFIKDLLMHGGGDHATMRGPARGPQASAAAVRATRAASGAIVVLRLHGVLVPRASDFAEQFGLLGIERFTQDFRAALADDSIGGIVLDVDSPGRRPMNEHEPKPASASHEDVPDWLSPEAQEHWPVIARQLADAGVLTVIEAEALAQYCEAFVIWRQAYEKVLKFGLVVKAQSGFPVQSPYLSIANHQSDRMLRILIEFGCTPSSRSRVTATPPDDTSPYAKFVKPR